MSQILPTIQTSPLLREVTFAEAKAYSPWPNRIAGIDHWQKAERRMEEVIKEYNDGWYTEALQFYTTHKDRYLGEDHPAGIIQCITDLERHLFVDRVEQLKDIYGGLPSVEYLISVGQKLFVANLYLFIIVYRQYVAQVVRQYMERYQVRAVIEMGSGMGINLFTLFGCAPLDYIRGGDLCEKGVELTNMIVSDFTLHGSFIEFSYYTSDDFQRLCDYDKDYILLTAHSIEQLPRLPEHFVDAIRHLKNPPRSVLHFEPVQFPIESTFDEQCLKYSQLNKYNQDLYTVLARAHESSAIELLDMQKHVLGLSAFNPTSFIAWAPKK